MYVIVFDGDFQAMQTCDISIERPTISLQNGSGIKTKPTSQVDVDTTKDCHSGDRYDYVHIYANGNVYGFENVIVESVDYDIHGPWSTIRMRASSRSVRENTTRKT